MQLSLIDEVPEMSKSFFLDVFAEAVVDANNASIRLETIDGQQVPCDLKVSVPRKIISKFPGGTIYKLDTRLVRKNGRKPYFIAVNRKNVRRAMEFFEYNLKVQNGFDYIPPTKKRKK
ncbi:hypothetical protein [Arcticibacterium luteifluviistationis]|uniref:Uncharacterized protein n=1 Tax=Arcticibacterium luteifluviistationis TaxID=1784714 RepID=A0A2Z4G9M6_9BACT|nr:hypothetical protein [Arcticibacterium luteifluviistationis]AWV97623.1 hypothetical protein DJ013_05370 [Arcticibacterium luteifluviistationis]